MNLIVFDIDDTLTKSEYQHQFAYVNTMKEFGISAINQNWKDYLHHTDSYILKENYENNLEDNFEFSFIDDFETRMTELILELDAVSEVHGAQNIINDLNKNPNYALTFATGSLLKPAFVKLDQAGINYNKSLVIGSNKIFEREGIVAEAIQKAKAFYKVDTFDNIISVGDGLWDLITARNLDVHFIGIGMKNYQDFKKEHIKLHIKDWNNFNLKDAEDVFFRN
ncbi:HAD family hydrolase [Psychroserpens jangbogonensis]|uniref:HAD family hydrolase n=1 Tax=Psychroserpens jangbogonensis TaxID=1484460 RepID=UPI00053CF479|nr:HAD family hydrolase [Psychroserpens jangbogonensis]